MYITTDYDSQIDRLYNEGVATDLLYQALSDLMALDLRGCWNNVEKAYRIAKMKAALAARQADVKRLAGELAELLSGKVAQVIAPALPVAVSAAAQALHSPAERSPRLSRPVIWSKHPY